MALVLVRKERFDLVVMRVGHVAGAAELTLALLAPAGEQVPFERAAELELAGRGPLEPLLRAGVSFDLGHGWMCMALWKAGSYAPRATGKQESSRGLEDRVS